MDDRNPWLQLRSSNTALRESCLFTGEGLLSQWDPSLGSVSRGSRGLRPVTPDCVRRVPPALWSPDLVWSLEGGGPVPCVSVPVDQPTSQPTPTSGSEEGVPVWSPTVKTGRDTRRRDTPTEYPVPTEV